MQNLAEKHFYRSSSVKLSAWSAACSGLLLIFIGFTHLSIFLYLGIINLILGILSISSLNKPTISLMDNHIQMKFSPLGATKYIKYSDIQSIEKKKHNLIFHLKTKKEETLPLSIVQKEARDELINLVMSINNELEGEQTNELTD
ncbi:hypothetical protein [Rodentibacter caecimuris]|uniref:DUF5673 domain-containing protein n=1 Tax=Rodentibacter caecimuris TaxID=1796644 RepID=A0ABX3KVI3_9PAST|nr:hypothetical protein BKG89_08995 [Rodentibacter heylii]